jgi:hypothetical protein
MTSDDNKTMGLVNVMTSSKIPYFACKVKVPGIN